MRARPTANLAGRAYERLRAAILEGRMRPGTPLSRRRLAEEWGMSPVPVGDAIAQLESEGLLESRPRAGTRVRIATAEEIHGNYVLREALETHSARLFAEQADERDRRKLIAAAAKLDAAYNALAASGRTRPAAQAPAAQAKVERIHIEFHIQVARATKVPVLMQAIERSRVLLFNWLFTLSSEFRNFPPRWHRDLARALARGTAAEAVEAMRAHVRFRQEEVTAYFSLMARAEANGARMERGPQRRKRDETPATSRV